MLQKAAKQLSGRQRKLLVGGGISLLVIFLAISLVSASSRESSRTESYKEVSGAAGLAATISYDCQQDCEQQFNFNVYFLNEAGQQISTVQPDAEGNVNMALLEGQYSMLIGKKFGGSNVFPQEPLALKNGKMLELKLHY